MIEDGAAAVPTTRAAGTRWEFGEAQALYRALRDGIRPAAAISAATWDSWRAIAREDDVAGVRIGSVARQCGLPWPCTRRKETFSQYADRTLPELKRMRSYGRKELATLVTCFAVVIRADDPLKTRPVSEEATAPPSGHVIPGATSVAGLHRAIIGDRRPSALISSEVWDSWRTAAVQHGGKTLRIESIADEHGLPWPAARFAETLSDFAQLTLGELERQHGVGRKKLAVLVTCFAAAAGAFDSIPAGSTQGGDADVSDHHPQHEPSGRGEEETLALLMAKLLARLPTREAEVLTRRFGLDGSQSRTLEEIGDDDDFQVTRERIRQIENRALQKLRRTDFKIALQEALQRELDQTWRQLTGGGLVLQESALSDAFEIMVPQTRLAIKVVYGKLSKWLKRNTTRFKTGWYRADVAVETLKELARSAAEWVNNNNQPVLFDRLCAALDADPTALQITINTDPGISVFLGYVFHGSLSARKRRRVRLHRLMLTSYGRQCTPATEIVASYRSSFSDDPCSLRDAELVMHDAPHLFLRCAEVGWVTLGEASLVRGRSGTVESEQDETVETDEQPVQQNPDIVETPALTGVIRAVLKRKGPLHLADIATICEEEAVKEYAATSVGAMLVTGNYVRLAPGVWGLPEHDAALGPVSEWLNVLLSEADCRMYARARYAGEPMGLYRMWTPAMEYEWARWAEQNASKEIFSSLLTVCQPNRWPGSPDIRAEWLNKKHRLALYRLRDPLKYSLVEQLPKLPDLLRVAIVADTRGHASWISANRVVGRRIDSHRAATALAILTELGVLTPARHWQEQHPAATECSSFVGRLAGHLHETGQLDWSSPIGQEVVENIVRGDKRSATSWATETELAALRVVCGHRLTPGTSGDSNIRATVDDALPIRGANEPVGTDPINQSIEQFLDER